MLDKQTLSRKRLYIGLILIAIALVLPQIYDAESVNSWSLAYAWRAMKKELIVEPLASPPPNHLGAQLWLARDSLAAGQPGRALELLATAPPERDFEILRIRALALEGEENYYDAIQVWIETHDVNLLRDASEQARLDRRAADAVVLMQAAYELDPTNETLNLANSLWNNAKDREGAIELLRSSIAAYPDSLFRDRWMLRLGDFLRFEQKWDEAASIYRQVIDEYPAKATAWIGLGWAVYGRDSDASEARAAFEKAVELAPETGDGYMAVAQLLAREDLHAEADSWFEIAIARSPSYRWWLLARANNARDGSDLDHAFQLYEELISRFPEFAPTYYEEASAYKLAGEQPDAIRAIEHAIELQRPSSSDYYVRAGQIYDWAGQQTAAEKAYERALELDPENRDAVVGLEALQE